MTPSEVWAAVAGHEGRYEVSNLGSVRSLSHTVIRANGVPHTVRGKTLSLVPTTAGYRCVRIAKKTRLVHQLVAEAFLGCRPEGATDVNHLNGAKSDNRAGNLEWATRSRNVLHAIQELGSKSGAPGHKMSTSFCRALSQRNAKPFLIASPEGAQFSGVNLTEFCRARGIPYNELLKIRNGSRKTPTTGWRLLTTSRTEGTQQ